MAEAIGAIVVAACGLALAGAALTRLGLRQRGHRGWQVWVATLAMGCLSMLAIGVNVAPAWPGIAGQTALMVWPVLILIGLRRFHARLGLLATEQTDRLVIAVSTGLAASLGAFTLEGQAPAAISIAAMLPSAYVGVLLCACRTKEDAGILRLMGGTAFLTGCAPVGAQDPASVQALGSALGMAVMAFTLLIMMAERTELDLRRTHRRLRKLAYTDPLTGIPNRRRFEQLIERALRADGATTAMLLMFDIDHFKLINDRLGHAAGDRALRLVGRCMNEALRAQDLAGRLGGDEFALLLRNATVGQSMQIASRIVTQLQMLSPEHHLPCLSLSFGVSAVREGQSVDEALQRADQGLYEAKRQGRSRVVAVQGGEGIPVFSESRRLGLTPL